MARQDATQALAARRRVAAGPLGKLVGAARAMPAPAKLHLRCPLVAHGDAAYADVRPMARADSLRLGELFYAAYVGTVDYEGESREDAAAAVEATFDGEYGEFMPSASMLAESAARIISASFVTKWQGQPLLAFAVTDPEHKGRGYSRRCTSAAMQALARSGYRELHLFVSATNTPALALYRKLGFGVASPAAASSGGSGG